MPTHRVRRAARLLALLTLAVAGCGGGGAATETGPPPVPARINIVAGGVVDDTVLAQSLQALVIEVRGTDGAPARGTTVRFEARPPADTTRRAERAVYVCPLSAPQCGPGATTGGDIQFTAERTDSAGRARALVRLGTVAGPAWIVVSAPEFGIRDSTAFTVRAGAAASVRFSTRDTTIYVGATVPLRPLVRDRFGNARQDAYTLSASAGDVVDVDAQGLVTGRQPGRARLYARGGASTDSAIVNVVPRGRLVAWAAYDGAGTIVTVNLDGSGLRRVLPNPSGNGAFPMWGPQSGRIVFHTGSPVLTLTDTLGVARPVGGAPSWFGGFSPDERAVYYVGASTGGYSAWRASADGSQPVALAPLPGFVGYPNGGAAFSPAGDRVAYTTTGASALSVVDLTTGRAQNLPAAVAPRWSPSGDRIAATTAFEGPIVVMNADGSGRRVLTTDAFSPGLTWAPDGQWLIGRRSSFAAGVGLVLVRVSDGLLVPLRFSLDLYQPNWR